MTRRWLALVLPLALSACGYNRIQSLDEQANAAQGQIEVQLQRRAELIPNLVATVKGMANQELAVFGEVARARGGLLNAVQTRDRWTFRRDIGANDPNWLLVETDEE